jgi:hypothetical protein
VTLRVRDEADLVDRAQVAGRHVQTDETAERGNEDPTRLHVDVLPALRLDVRVRDVLREEAALAGDIAFGHGFSSY